MRGFVSCRVPRGADTPEIASPDGIDALTYMLVGSGEFQIIKPPLTVRKEGGDERLRIHTVRTFFGWGVLTLHAPTTRLVFLVIDTHSIADGVARVLGGRA